jgi:Flp pilus assembly protein TadG
MRRQGKEAGYTLVIIAAVLVVFLGFTALSVDVGVLYSARASAQRAADAAALAGAFVYITRADLSETTVPKQSDVIKENAIKTAATNKMLGAPVTISTSDVTVEPSLRRVTVRVTQSQPTLFARILGENSANIHAEAVAEAATNGTADSCAKPIFLPNTIVSANNACAACSAGEVLISGGAVTGYASTKLGMRIQLKPNSASDALAPGQFYAVQFPNDPEQDGNGGTPGGDAFRDNIATCPPTAVVCHEFYPVKTGNMVGPTNQGFSTLIGTPNQDTFVSIGQYLRANGTTTSTSRSLAIAPVWDVCGLTGFCPDGDFPQGSNQTVEVIGFALIFIEGKCNPDVAGCGPPSFDPNAIVGRLIGVSSCAPGGGTINPAETGAFSLPIRLVRVP